MSNDNAGAGIITGDKLAPPPGAVSRTDIAFPTTSLSELEQRVHNIERYLSLVRGTRSPSATATPDAFSEFQELERMIRWQAVQQVLLSLSDEPAVATEEYGEPDQVSEDERRANLADRFETAAQIIRAGGRVEMNEHGSPVSVHTCPGCQKDFTVCPPVMVEDPSRFDCGCRSTPSEARSIWDQIRSASPHDVQHNQAAEDEICLEMGRRARSLIRGENGIQVFVQKPRFISFMHAGPLLAYIQKGDPSA